ncbi:hypothetical protein [Sphingomonas sp. Y38-1Y]|uniref:hypothetical protein n=1 Tax=Sphingomonas sp. Y38-1Y TaxID=3078265 RepID=UPI0028E81ED1|nr:hypothetical protein [Sphingomonas sp. Y38-1Y]
MSAARWIVALAALSLGQSRRAWGEAMMAEFEAAEEDGQPLRFAVGCLIGAWRTMPTNEEGRFRLASYVLAIGLMVPVGTALLIAAALGFPFVETRGGVADFLAGGSHPSLLNVGNFTIAPSLCAVMLALALCHLPLAWWTLDGNWRGVAAMTRFGAAAITTLAIVTTLVALNPLPLLMPLAALGVELAGIAVLIGWQATLTGEAIGTA